MMLFAFTQCGGTVKGSKEYQESMKLYEKFEKEIKDAKTCEDLQDLAFGLIFSGLASNEYADDEKMTEQEEEKLDEYVEKLGEIIEEKAKKLGCDDD